MIGALSASRRRTLVAALLEEDFSRYSNGAVPATAITGQVWGLYSGPATVQGGRFDSTEGTGASYLEANLNTAYDKAVVSFRFNSKGGTRTGTGSSLCVPTWADGGIVANGTGRSTSAHPVITHTNVIYSVRATENGTLVALTAQNLSTPLALDTDYTATIVVDRVAHTATVTVGGRTPLVFSDSRITTITGENFNVIEPFYNNDGTDARCEVNSVKFYGTPPVVPVTPTVVSSGFVGTSDAAVTTRSITLPALKGGDIVILLSEVLGTSTTHTQTAGPTFTASPENKRTGISLGLFTRTAAGTLGSVSADSGQVVTITYNESIGGMMGYIVLRNFLSVGAVTALNQASGSTVITAPAFTAGTTKLPLHIIAVGRSASAAAVLTPRNTTPASNMAAVASDLPIATGRRSGILFGINFTANQAVDPVWNNTNNHYAATYLVELNI